MSATLSPSADPVPPFFHLVASEEKLNSATGEIEQTLTFHEGARIVICYSPEQVGSAVVGLLQACGVNFTKIKISTQ